MTLTLTPPKTSHLRVAVADDAEREAIYGLRHAVYAAELRQHPTNAAARLRDALDAFNTYLVVSAGDEIAGYVSVTPPGGSALSIDKYLARADLPFACDEHVYEVRLLTVLRPHRGSAVAGLLMYAALRWVESHGGTRVVAIGRREVLSMYERVGLVPLGRTVRSGDVTYELLTATVDELRDRLTEFRRPLGKLGGRVEWALDVPFAAPAPCFHGGAFFDAVGEDFDDLGRAEEIINADVLDAWFPPAPGVLDALRDHLPWLVRTSPPTHCGGMTRAIARARGVDAACVLPGAGSSDLIYLALRHWLGRDARALILDPTYGEYAHVLRHVIGCQVDLLPLSRADGYRLDLTTLATRLTDGYDLVVLVNPNSPTGQHVPARALRDVLAGAPPRTRVWLDETYVDYAGPDESLEAFACASANVVVCKSMSKAYALSGLRAAYLCGPEQLIRDLRAITPPWAVSLPAQVAAVRALADPGYYAARYAETRALREALRRDLLARTPLDVLPGAANFHLCHLPDAGPTAAEIVRRCRRDGLFIRDAAEMGRALGHRTVRVAVKDGETNERIVEIIARAMEGQAALAGDTGRPDCAPAFIDGSG